MSNRSFRLIKDQKFGSIFLYYLAMLYPAPSTLSYFWNFGIYALVCLIIQIITGIFLAMHYTSHQVFAFASVEHIMRNVNYGWLLRYIHSNGASMFFIVVYIHIFRGIFYSSFAYPKTQLWFTGVIILFVMIITGFMGYVLPWGQMSFWGATVITNLVSVIPFFGQDIVIWLWGGYSVDNPTLTRFFSLHYLMPFILLILTIVHLLLLHVVHSSSPGSIKNRVDPLLFYPYYVIKDIFGIILFFIFFSFFVFFSPNYLGHPDNYIQANSLVTPTHIVPEWYYLTFYAILRSIPNKLIGVIALLVSIFILLVLPFVFSFEISSMSYRPISRIFFWIFVVVCYILCWVGGKPAEFPYIPVGQISSIYYFLFFTFILPVLSKFERTFGYFFLPKKIITFNKFFDFKFKK